MKQIRDSRKKKNKSKTGRAKLAGLTRRTKRNGTTKATKGRRKTVTDS